MKTAKAAVDLLSKSNNNELIIFGGEPLLHIDLVIKTIRYAVQKKINNIKITTNGTIFSKQIADICKKNNVKIQISIDGNENLPGCRPFKNGKSSYNLVFNNIKKYKEGNVDVLIALTANPGNTKTLSRDFLYLLKNFSKVALIVAIGVRWSKREVENLKKELDKINKYFLDSIIKQRKIPDIPFIKENLRKIIKNEVKPKYCLKRKINAVMPNGDIYFCMFLKELDKERFKIGNVLQRGINKEQVEKARKLILNDCKKCKNIINDNICLMYDEKMKRFNKTNLINMKKAQDAVMDSTKRLHKKIYSIINKESI